MRRHGAVVGVGVGAAVGAALLVAGCGGGGDDLVVDGEPVARAYDGRLAGENAALRALECDWEEWGDGGGGEPWSEGDGGDSPEDGLAFYFDMEAPGLPESGYRVEREEDDRVLFSYDVDGETKAAVVVARDVNGPDWGPESAAACDVVEFGLPDMVEDGGEVWTAEDGRRAPQAAVRSHPGAESCAWQDAHFVELGSAEDPDEGGVRYGRDPESVLPEGMLVDPFVADGDMPADARDTGYRHEEHGWELWRVPDDASAVYVRTADGVEEWPRVTNRWACAG
ncbi:hypothetical protein ACTWP5_09695 [Streptomyces sp. 4N509B]|uniref:hypothetical protein n=1 Tax=Streptomyces sp. 4N509B TaxID=3457413 RepID=UPI003FD3878C